MERVEDKYQVNLGAHTRSLKKGSQERDELADLPILPHGCQAPPSFLTKYIRHYTSVNSTKEIFL